VVLALERSPREVLQEASPMNAGLYVMSSDIARARSDLNLDVAGFAMLVGVHPSTVYRWEATSGPLTMEPLQKQLIVAIKLAVQKDLWRVREQVRKGLLECELRGLYELLKIVFEGFEYI
jgi:hypothetical protein